MHCFQWFFDGFGVIPPLVSMVMDNWSDNAMVLMDHSPLNFHKIENFKLADPAVEGDPKIWHRSFWLSAVTLNKHKSMCALPLPPDLQLAGDIFGSSEWCSCLCWEVDSSCTKKYDVKSTLLTHKVQKKIAILWKVLSTTPLLRQLHACILNAD